MTNASGRSLNAGATKADFDRTIGMMIEKRYGAFIVDATEDLQRRAMVPMATGEDVGP